MLYQPGLKDGGIGRSHTAGAAGGTRRAPCVSEAMLAAAPVKLVVRAGAGYNTIDVAAASKRGIYVSNCPGHNTRRRCGAGVPPHPRPRPQDAGKASRSREGRWCKGEFSKARGLLGRTLGLIGLGRLWGIRRRAPKASECG